MIDLRDLSKKRVIEFDYNLSLNELEILGEKPFKQPVRAFGKLENFHGTFTLSANITGKICTECGKCLKPLFEDMDIPVKTIITKSFDDRDNEEVYFTETDVVELEEIFISEILLNVDMAYYCDENCKGLCIKCGKDLNEGVCTCDTRNIDERLSVLSKLLKNED